MRFRMVALLLVGGLLALGCGKTTDIAWNFEEDYREDQVAFVAPGSDTALRMNADGTNVTQRSGSIGIPKVWPNQQRMLNGICGSLSTIPFGSEPDYQGDPIEVVSPDGASLGPLDDSWSPSWSPDGNHVAVACGRDDNGTVVVVSNVEKPGNRDGWSRNGRGTLSDRMEVWLIRVDGAAVTQLTANQGGDWLPRFHKDAVLVVLESNRDGNSEIYLEEVISTASYRLTNRDADDQAPVWSKGGDLVAFASNATGNFEVHVTPSLIGEPFATGQAGRPVPWPS